MHVLRVECAEDDRERLIAELWARGTLGVIEEDLAGRRCVLKAFFEERFAAGELGGVWESAEEQDWVAVSQEQWEPALVGQRFFLVPEWRDDPTPPGRVRLEMQPAQACGTGWGPATRLALEAIEKGLQPGATALDVGTGSGILAVAMKRLGAARVCACDIDSEAVVEAHLRLLRERIEVALWTGSLRAVRDAVFDFVAANINTETLLDLTADLRRVLKPGGALALSGFQQRHLPRITAAFGEPALVFALGDWRSVLFQSLTLQSSLPVALG